VVEEELPTIEIVPVAEKFRYIRASDEIVETHRSKKAINQLYTSLVSQAVLRYLCDLFKADTASALESIVLNGVVSTIDPATGRHVRPCLVSVRATRDQFLNIDLTRVDPVLCLRELRATVSRQPSELVAVKPIIEFNMVDPRFVEKIDVLSALDQKPNLMELSPSEFESLITNLFEKMGLETRLTQASRDGGVDCVAFDSRSILGGKVVIQAKRYKNTVGVSAVRDLFGTMHNEGASKGIFVTTSGYGKAAYEFANGKPLELITGSNLLFLLREHTGCEAKIDTPPDWIDPGP
jgi:restriction system protein